MITRTRAAAPVVPLMLALLMPALVACGGSEPAGAPGEASSSPTDAGSATETPSGTDETGEAEPTVAPATGKVIRVEGLKVRTPQGWNTSIPLALQQAAFPPAIIGTIMRVYRFPNSGLYTIDELADEEVGEYGSRGKRLDDLELDGQQVYHLTGNPDRGVYAERFGTIVDDFRVFLEFQFANDEDRAARDEIIQSVLPTVQFG